jgi:Tol biopolymer transport system component
MKLALPLVLLAAVVTGGQNRIVYDHRDSLNGWNIFRINADGTGQRGVTRTVAHNFEPSVSPDGKYLAFGSERNGFGYQIFISDFLGIQVVQLTSPNFVDHAPAWSPDGSKIAFGRCNPDQTICDVYTINRDGTNETPVCGSPQDDDSPRFSPDGQQIVFASNRSGNYEIYKCSVNGSNVTPLAASPAVDLYPSWTSDGSKIIFSSSRDAGSTYELYLMNADGSNVIRLTNNTVNDIYPDFSSDGTRLVWSRKIGTNYEIMEAPLAALAQAKQLTSNTVDDMAPHYHFITRKAGRFR